jgi:hypothetical protein
MFGLGRTTIEKAGLQVADHLAETTPAGNVRHAQMRNYVSNLCRTPYMKDAGRQLVNGGMDAPSVFASLAVIAWLPLKFNASPLDDYAKDLTWIASQLAKTSAQLYLGSSEAAYDEAYQMDTWFTLDGKVIPSTLFKRAFGEYNDPTSRYQHILFIFGLAQASKYVDEYGAPLPGVDEEEAEGAWDVGEAKAQKLWNDLIAENGKQRY